MVFLPLVWAFAESLPLRLTDGASAALGVMLFFADVFRMGTGAGLVTSWRKDCRASLPARGGTAIVSGWAGPLSREASDPVRLLEKLPQRVLSCGLPRRLIQWAQVFRSYTHTMAGLLVTD